MRDPVARVPAGGLRLAEFALVPYFLVKVSPGRLGYVACMLNNTHVGDGITSRSQPTCCHRQEHLSQTPALSKPCRLGQQSETPTRTFQRRAVALIEESVPSCETLAKLAQAVGGTLCEVSARR